MEHAVQFPRHALSLAALAAVSSLVLTGCGGGDDGDKDGKIEGAQSSKGTPKESVTGQTGDGKGEGEKGERGDFRTSDIKLPADIDLVFDWQQPSDPDKAAALSGAADYMRALRHGTVKQDPKDPVLARHTVPLQSAETYATTKIKMDVDDGYTLTGKERFYRENVGDVADGRLVEVSFCSDQTDFFGKEVKGGKVLRTGKSPLNYTHLSLVMQKPTKATDPWKARTLEREGKAVKKCKE
ncbi:hypothetical protein [Streptomyces axinellae]